MPELSKEEIRVLGSLMEKSRTTPEYYPMTLNSLKSACNQRTSRNPVVAYNEETIIQALDDLKRKGLVSTIISGGGSRVPKYKHNLLLTFPINPEEAAILCLLMLRGPLTSGEINANSGRLYEFEDLEEVNAVLQRLSEKEPAFVKQIIRRPGQKENRFGHLFSDEETTVTENASITDALDPSKVEALELRIANLEAAFSRLRNEFNNLMEELG